jgi:hypothetical protein
LTKLLDEVLASELTGGKSDPYDSHPPLRERIEALRDVPGPNRPADARRAIDLVADADAIESAEIRSHVDRELAPIAWDDVGSMWSKRWREIVKSSSVLADLSIGTLPAGNREIYQLAARAFGDSANHAEDGELRQWWVNLAGAAIAVMLLEDGYAVTTGPGEPFVFTLGDTRLEPFHDLAKLVGGELSREDWVARWTALGYAERKLR